MDDRGLNSRGTEAESKAIQKILKKILEKWRLEIEAESEELKQTLFLSPPEVTREAPVSPLEVEMKDTISIIKAEEPLKIKAEEPLKEGDFSQETVILKPGKAVYKGKNKING
jgi:hypothetical protein